MGQVDKLEGKIVSTCTCYSVKMTFISTRIDGG